MAAVATDAVKKDTIDGFLRYSVYPSRAFPARGLTIPKLGRPTEVRSGGSPFIRTLAFNNDGTRLAVGHETRVLRLYPVAAGVITDRPTSLPPKGESPHRGNVGSLAWSPTDPNTLVSGCKGARGDSVVAVWDVCAGTATQFSIPGDVLHVAFHPSGRHFAAVCPRIERDVVFFYHLKDGVWAKREDVQINGAGVPGGEEQVNSFRFGNGGGSGLAVNQEGALNTWFYPVDEIVRGQTAERPAKRARTEEKEEAEEEAEVVEREPTPEAPEVVVVPETEGEGEGEGEGEMTGEGEGEAVAEDEAGEGEGAEGEEADATDKPEGKVDGDEPAAQAESSAADAATDGDAVMADASPAHASPAEPALPTPARTPAPGTPAPATLSAGAPAASAQPSRAPSPTQAEKDAASALARAAREAHTRQIQLERGPRKGVSIGLSLALAVDPRGRYYAVGGHDARLSLLSTTTLAATRTWDDYSAPIRHLSFSHDGEFLAVGGDEAIITIFAVGNGAVVARIPCMGHATALSWHPGNVLAYATNAKNRGVGWWYVTVDL
ncbi:hypothetical protein CspHIS471_0705370 [Cutaneotrichosporon sp. HIS471]|nr:hypothetical protein CspHIS471_0705370 [Cutaneotrichosporon sp. HIS471]